MADLMVETGVFDSKSKVREAIKGNALAINKFHNADIYIPFSVIEEIDRFKRDLGENGRNARHFSRLVDVLREKGSLAQGCELESAKSFVYVISDFHFKGLPADNSGNYLVDHTYQVYLVDDQGRLRATFFDASVEEMSQATWAIVAKAN